MGMDGPRRRSTKPHRFHGPFTGIEDAILESQAWESITCAARVAYLHIRKDDKGYNRTELKLPYSQAEKLMGRKTFTRAIRMLVDHGFITINQPGGLMQHCTEYGLSDQWRYWKPPPMWPR